MILIWVTSTWLGAGLLIVDLEMMNVGLGEDYVKLLKEDNLTRLAKFYKNNQMPLEDGFIHE